MCIVIDTNTLAKVFNKNTPDHKEFKSVLDWIITGKGKIVYGGSKYQKEIGKFIGLFIQMRNAKKAVYIDNSKVDKETQTVSSMLQHVDFNDQHLVGLLRISGCKLICSCDDTAYKFFRHQLFFKPARNKPKIYKGKRNHSILVDKNIAPICMPCISITKGEQAILENALKVLYNPKK